MKNLIDKLKCTRSLNKEEFKFLLETRDENLAQYLFAAARSVREEIYGKDVYIRGLIEFTSYCKNDCYYCGLRRRNRNAERYRLSKAQILACCREGYDLGFRTFVLQGGQDDYYSDERLVDIISAIKERHPDCAVTLSIDERSFESYKRLKDAGADRYLLRHETSNSEHYSKLHPKERSLENRKRCLHDLKALGFQIGCGFMVGSPHQTPENLAEDLLFVKELEPQMVGMGPFIAHKDTPFASKPSGTLEETLFILGLLRLMQPNLLLPATTALGTIHERGRELGILAGANVVMPNLSPICVRKKYSLYDNKICTQTEAAEHVNTLKAHIEQIGYKIVVGRGDFRECPR